MIITHRNHPDIVQILRLQHRKERDRTGLFFIEGVRFVSEAVALQEEILQLVVSPPLLTQPYGQKLARRLQAKGTPCLMVSPEQFREISQTGDRQGIGAVLRQRWETLEGIRPSNELGWIVLDTVLSPGNLGTILRTCDAVGASGVVLIGERTDLYDPATVRASMGAIFTQRLVRTGQKEFSAWKRRQPYLVVGTSPSAARDYREVPYRKPILLFMGCEQHGLSNEQQALCDIMVRIPMVGRSDSLNLGVATSVALYEIYNQRHPIRRP